MAGFKLTYGNMFNPPEEMHKGFDKAVAKLKANLGREYAMIIDGQDVFADDKYEDRSPVNTDWVLAVMQKGNATQDAAEDAKLIITIIITLCLLVGFTFIVNFPGFIVIV